MIYRIATLLLIAFVSLPALFEPGASFASHINRQQDETGEQGSLPDWEMDYPVATFFAHEFEPAVKMVMKGGPARITCVRSSVSAYYNIKDASIRNAASKPIVAVKLSWTLSMEQPPNTVLEIWESGLVPVGEVPPQKVKAFGKSLRFNNVFKSPAEAEIDTWMIAEVSVDEIVFKDGTRWKRERANKPKPKGE